MTVVLATSRGYRFASKREGLLPGWLIEEELRTGKLVRILRDYRESVYETHAVWLQTPYLPLKIRLAVDMLVSRLPTSMT